MYGIYGLWLVCLYSSIGCWIFLFIEIFFFVDLGVGLVFVGGVVIQGCNDDECNLYGYVLEYLLLFSDDGIEWYYYFEERVFKVFKRLILIFYF